MFIKKKNLYKIIESFLLEDENDKKNEEDIKDHIKIEDFVREGNELIFSIDVDNLTGNISMPNIEFQKDVAGDEFKSYLNLCLLYAYNSDTIKTCLHIFKKLEMINEEEEESLFKELQSKTKPNIRTKVINQKIFKKENDRIAITKAQSILNNILHNFDNINR